jgi:integrase
MPKCLYGELVAKLMSVYAAKSKKTYIEFESTNRLHLLPFFANKPLDDIGALWDDYAAEERKKNPNRKLKHDKKVLTVTLRQAVRRKLILKAPELPLDPYDKSVRPGRFVSEAELEEVCFYATRNLNDLLRVLYYTGMRFSEARRLRVDQVNFATQRIYLGPKDTKTRSARIYPLQPQVASLLRLRVKRHKSAWFFPNRAKTAPMADSQRGFQKARALAGVSFTLHDLRRSFITTSLRKGMAQALVQKLVGCSPETMQQSYVMAAEEDWVKVLTEVPVIPAWGHQGVN